jgi:hypothetical protein
VSKLTSNYRAVKKACRTNERISLKNSIHIVKISQKGIINGRKKCVFGKVKCAAKKMSKRNNKIK